jgi:plasmid maintenance system antidote protein VapI
LAASCSSARALLTIWPLDYRAASERIAREEKPVTADTALRLGKFFKTGAAYWMNIQARFDIETARWRDILPPRMLSAPRPSPHRVKPRTTSA